MGIKKQRNMAMEKPRRRLGAYPGPRGLALAGDHAGGFVGGRAVGAFEEGDLGLGKAIHLDGVREISLDSLTATERVVLRMSWPNRACKVVRFGTPGMVRTEL